MEEDKEMICPKCGKEISNSSKFCQFCGSSIIQESSSGFQNSGNEAGTQETFSGNMSGTPWFFIKAGVQQGPFDEQYIISQIKTGTINRDTYVWQKGMPQWLPAAQTYLVNYMVNMAPPVPDNVISSKYAWALATVPIAVSILLGIVLKNSIAVSAVAIILNCIFIYLDVSLLKKAGRAVESWLWLGILLVPVYLFVRASKTDKNYAYGITWCVLFVIDIII
jgi:hypothetical protein